MILGKNLRENGEVCKIELQSQGCYICETGVSHGFDRVNRVDESCVDDVCDRLTKKENLLERKKLDE